MVLDRGRARRHQALTRIQAQKLTHTAPGHTLLLLPQSLEKATVSLRTGPRPSVSLKAESSSIKETGLRVEDLGLCLGPPSGPLESSPSPGQ